MGQAVTYRSRTNTPYAPDDSSDSGLHGYTKTIQPDSRNLSQNQIIRGFTRKRTRGVVVPVPVVTRPVCSWGAANQRKNDAVQQLAPLSTPSTT